MRPRPGSAISQSTIEQTVLPSKLAPDVEARHRRAGLTGHRPVALGAVEACHGAGELEVVGQRHVAEIAALVLRAS
jgi:hypothetical protein